MANARIWPRNFFDEASSLSATSEVAGMTLANAQLPARSKFWRSTSIATQVLQGNWAGAGRYVNAFGLFRHNAYGGTARLQLYSDSAWTTQIYDSTALNVTPSIALGAFDWGIDPLGLTATDPYIYEAPFLHYFTAPGTAAASWRVTLDGSGGLGAGYWQLGRLWLGKYWELAYNPRERMPLGFGTAAERNRSAGGSLRTSSGAALWRTLDMDLAWISDADLPTWLDVMRYAGVEKDIVVSIFAALGGRLERDYTINGRFTSLDPIAYGIGTHAKRVSIEEN